jgi:hypothetical protein
MLQTASCRADPAIILHARKLQQKIMDWLWHRNWTIFFATNLSEVLQKHKMMVKDHTWVLKKYFATRARNVACCRITCAVQTEPLEFASQEK